MLTQPSGHIRKVKPSSQEFRPPVNENVRRQMRNQRVRDTGTEQTLRRYLHSRGLRFRLHRRLLPNSRREIDIAFIAAKVAVFVDGCFWHGCPEHATWPKRNAQLWKQKIETNRHRDSDTNSRLQALGWTVIRVWEHEDPTAASERIAAVVEERSRVS